MQISVLLLKIVWFQFFFSSLEGVVARREKHSEHVVRFELSSHRCRRSPPWLAASHGAWSSLICCNTGIVVLPCPALWEDTSAVCCDTMTCNSLGYPSSSRRALSPSAFPTGWLLGCQPFLARVAAESSVAGVLCLAG